MAAPATSILHQGNIVKANADTAMVVINQVKPVYVDFALPEQQLAIGSKQHGVASTGGGGCRARRIKTDVHGKLSFVDNTVDANTGTIQLKGLFDNQDQKLWPGQFVDTYLTLSELPNAVLVPSQAVQTGSDGSYVFVIDPQDEGRHSQSRGRRHHRGRHRHRERLAWRRNGGHRRPIATDSGR